MLSAEETVLEPDSCDLVFVSGCFSANVEEPLNSSAVFEFIPSNLTTASYADFVEQTSSPFLTIPSGFVGQYDECLNIAIIGDDKVEEDERIVYSLVPISERDRVTFPPNSTELLVINILNNDSKAISNGV